MIPKIMPDLTPPPKPPTEVCRIVVPPQGMAIMYLTAMLEKLRLEALVDRRPGIRVCVEDGDIILVEWAE